MRFDKYHLEKLPAPMISPKQSEELTKRVIRMLELQAQLELLGGKKTAESNELVMRINSLDYEIDEKVFDLYGLDDKEKSLIRESTK